MRYFCLPLCACLLLSASSAAAEIYTWQDAQGTVHYSDKPHANAKPANLPGLQSLDKVPVDASNQPGNTQSPAGSTLSLAITRPLPQETFRDALGVVPAQAAVSPGLTPDQQLVYLLDGEPTPTSPTRNTALQLQNVTRGEHSLSVAVFDQGKEIARSPPVVFYMKPPSAITPVNQSAPRPPEQQPAGATTAPPSTAAPGTPAAPRFGISSGPAGPAVP